MGTAVHRGTGIGRTQRLRVPFACNHAAMHLCFSCDRICRPESNERRGSRRSSGASRRRRKILENRSWNGHVPAAIWARPTLPTKVGRPTCIMGGDRQDQGQSCSFSARNHDTWGARPRQGCPRRLGEAHRDKGRYRTSQASRRQFGGSALPSPGTRACTWGWFARGWDVQLGRD